MPQPNWVIAPWAASVFVLVFALLNNGRHSMWFDEAYSSYFAGRNFNQLLHDLATDEANMGPYYLLLWGWRRFGESDVWLRSLSIIGTVAAVWLVWAVVSRWASRAAAAAAVCMLALNPFVLTWTVQARGYTFVVALSVLSLWLAEQVRVTSSVKYAIAFGVNATVLVATNLASVFIVVAQVCCIVVYGKRQRLVRPLGMGALVSSVLFAPFAYAFLTNRGQVKWIPELSMDQFARSTWAALGGRTAAAALLLGCAVLLARLREPRTRPVIMLVLASVTGGVLGLAAFSLIVQPLFVNRYLIGVLPIATIGAVLAFDGLRTPRLRTAALAVLPLAVLMSGVLQPSSTTQWTLEDYRGAARRIDAAAASGDAVINVDGHTSITLGRYLEGDAPILDVVQTGDARNPFGLRNATTEPSRVWLVLRATSFDETAPERAKAQRTWITALYPVVIKRWELDGITLELRSHGG